MGNRCYVSVCVRTDDWNRWDNALNEQGSWGGPGSVETDGRETRLGFEESYPDFEGSENFPKGVPFYGYHEEHGGDYGPFAFASDGETRLDWPLHEGGSDQFAFEVDDDGNPKLTEEWRRFWAHYRRVRRHIELGEPLELVPSA